MDYSHRLAISYYKTIATINEPHKVYLVQHQENHHFFVKKELDVYNLDVYKYLYQNPIEGIPRIFDYYEDEGHLTVIEEYISGYPLQEKINTSCLTVDSITHYMLDLCEIIEKLHCLNPPIVHRDIKPSNIIITNYDRIVLLDFNAAKYFTGNNSSDTILLGTRGYAAPEQYGFGSSSPQTDIYSLGILLKELVSTLTVHTDKFDKIIDICTQMSPADRYQSVSELKLALSGCDKSISCKNSSFTIRNLLPPGYRTLTPWKIAVATIVYPFIFLLSLTLEAENTYGAALWIERFFCLMIMLSVIFGCFNYLDIQRFFPLCQHKNRFIHYIGIALLDFIMVILLFILMLIIESVCF